MERVRPKSGRVRRRRVFGCRTTGRDGFQISCGGAYSSSLPDFADVVVEIDERGDFSQADQQVQFRKSQNSVYAVAIEQVEV